MDISNQPVLTMKGISKKFGTLLANDNVDFELNRGEIHCLLGENGAGKSTLMNVLFGLYAPDSGQIIINNQTVNFNSPKDAIASGLGMVHQHFMLVPVFNAVENIILGLGETNRGVLKVKEAERKVSELADSYSLPINTKIKMWQMSVGEQQRVEILKILYRGAKILILDEPTSVLTPSEVNHLASALEILKNDGCSIIFITHKLWEAIKFSDKITVMRDGKVVGTVFAKNTDAKLLAKMMVGRDVLFSLKKVQANIGSPVLKISNVHALNDRGLEALRNVSLKVNAGEIVGVAGVAGNGQKELAEVICNLRKTIAGTIIIRDQTTVNCSPMKVYDLGVSYIPEDRIHRGAAQDLSIRDNMIIKHYLKHPFSHKGFLRFDEIEDFVKILINEYNVKCQDIEHLSKQLSGGNLQKTILARELCSKPALVIAEQPTNGLDIGAIEFVHKKLLESRDNGAGVLLISADLDEILKLSDRIIVMFEGEIVGEVDIQFANIDLIGEWMTGHGKMKEDLLSHKVGD